MPTPCRQCGTREAIPLNGFQIPRFCCRDCAMRYAMERAGSERFCEFCQQWEADAQWSAASQGACGALKVCPHCERQPA